MKEVVNSEVAEFMKFAQNAAKSCTQDYDCISEDALLYTEVITDAVFNSAVQQWYWNCDEVAHTLLVGCSFPELLIWSWSETWKFGAVTQDTSKVVEYNTVWR